MVHGGPVLPAMTAMTVTLVDAGSGTTMIGESTRRRPDGREQLQAARHVVRPIMTRQMMGMTTARESATLDRRVPSILRGVLAMRTPKPSPVVDANRQLQQQHLRLQPRKLGE